MHRKGSPPLAALPALLLVANLTGCAAGLGEAQPTEAPSPPPKRIEEATQEPAAEADAPLPEEEALSGPSPTLDRFYAKAEALRNQDELRHLRIGVLGDSHIQADFWTGALRRRLQHRLGDGGLGFVHIGWPGYRHDGVRLERQGEWRSEPRPMSTGRPYDDGVLGLGGVRVVGEEGSFAKLELLDADTKAINLDIAYRLPTCPSRAHISLKSEGGATEEARITLACAFAEEAGEIEHLELLSSGNAASIEIEVEEGRLELFGVVVEAREPGAVVDALGISGARANTPLAWDAESFAAELRRRDYDLFVVAYGTNDSVPAAEASVPAFGRNLTALIERLQSASGDKDCLIIGPMDRGPLKRRNTAPEERIVELNAEAARVAEEQSCAFWSALETMGGLGSIRDWAAMSPPLAQPDLVHLSRAGYARLGEALADFLLEREGVRIDER